MRTRLVCVPVLMVVALVLVMPAITSAQNTSFGMSVHMLAGQPPVRVTLPTGSADRFYDAVVVVGRSYCAEATASETELNSADPTLTVFRADQTTELGPDTGLQEPKGQVAARICFVAPASETVYVRLSPASPTFENREYAMRFVETTLWANWFFVGGAYSSYTLLRNTTSAGISATIVWRADTGAQVGPTTTVTIPANGVYYVDTRTILSCPYPTVCAALAGSVEVAHTGSPEAIVGSQTTLSGTTGLSFDTIMFQRRAW